MSRNTIARIDLSAIDHNLSQVRKAAPDSRIACVVKADAYGHGLSRIFDAISSADIVAVATVGEGRACRNHGWNGRLLMLEGPSNAAEFDEICAMHGEMVVHHQTQLDLLRQRRDAITAALWLKIDTGMHRLGFPAAEAAAVHREMEFIRCRERTVLMTHFACADEADNPMTAAQIDTFDSVTADIRGETSLANSAGLINFPHSQREYVRPGIMVYGVSPCRGVSAQSLGLRPAMTLTCDLIAINHCRSGDQVGYGAAYTCPVDMRIGVAAIGYGDGYPRHARNGTPVLLNGRRAFIAGRVSMDMVTIDLRGHDDAEVGDQVILWGEGLPVEEVAPWADAIPYQLICGVTARVKEVAV
jgi:alanine racemase